jgi:ADP-heptose:LPS heptosyltransferase
MCNFDVAIILRPTLTNALSVYSSGIPIRIGTGYRLYSILFNKRLQEHRRENIKSEMEYNLSLLRFLEIKAYSENNQIKPQLYVTKQNMKRAESFLESNGISEDNMPIMIHPGGRDSAPKWPFPKYLELTRKLCGIPGVKIMITGVSKEFTVQQLNELRTLKNEFNGRLLNLIDETNLLLLMGIMNQTKLVVTNSTGTAHIAAGLGTPLVAIYPDSNKFSLRRWKPIGNHKSMKILSAVNPGNISVDDIFANCEKLLIAGGEKQE